MSTVHEERTAVPQDPLWKKMTEYFGVRDVAIMVHATESDVRQFLWRQQDSENGVRDRAMFILGILDVLEDIPSFPRNAVRGWFYHSNPALNGKSVFGIFRAEWTPELPGPVLIMELTEQRARTPRR
jgi:hypothetical protein